MSGRELESYAVQIVQANENMLVPWILMAAFLYYNRNCNLVSDHVYDRWCRRAKYRWRFLHHRHKELITYDPEARTVMVMLGEDDYPTLVKDAAIELARKYGLTRKK